MAQTERPLRKDAARNRQRILDAARELFAERGLAVTLNEIAHHAGVGVGTVYRRFPDKAQLIDGLFEQRVDDLRRLMEQALDNPDPWRGLIGFVERSLELQAADRGLRELILGGGAAYEHVAKVRARLQPLAARLLARAQEAGQLRADLTVQDMAILQLMLGSVIDGSRDIDPQLWRRYLAIAVEGIRARPEPVATLPVSPPPFDRVDEILVSSWDRQR
jgi:AcrR family transcriptional regulator